jgi:hypothetical protein
MQLENILDDLEQELENDTNESPSHEGEEETLEEDTASESFDNDESTDDEESDAEAEETEDDGNTQAETKPEFDHPRFVSLTKKLSNFEEENNSLRQQLEEINKKIAETQSAITSNQPEEVPDWFKESYGDDQGLYKQYLENIEKERQAIKQSIVEELRQEQTKEQQETQQARQWLENELDSIATEAGGLTKSARNEIVKTALDYNIRDDENRYDLRSAYTLYTKLKAKEQENVSAKKRVASQSMSSTNQAVKDKTMFTPDDVRDLF